MADSAFFDRCRAMTLNQTAVRQLGYSSPGLALGKKFDQFGSKGTITGVVKDFHFRNRLEPGMAHLQSQHRLQLHIPRLAHGHRRP
jgi:hypothetical protein